MRVSPISSINFTYMPTTRKTNNDKLKDNKIDVINSKEMEKSVTNKGNYIDYKI